MGKLRREQGTARALPGDVALNKMLRGRGEGKGDGGRLQATSTTKEMGRELFNWGSAPLPGSHQGGSAGLGDTQHQAPGPKAGGAPSLLGTKGMAQSAWLAERGLGWKKLPLKHASKE